MATEDVNKYKPMKAQAIVSLKILTLPRRDKFWKPTFRNTSRPINRRKLMLIPPMSNSVISQVKSKKGLIASSAIMNIRKLNIDATNRTIVLTTPRMSNIIWAVSANVLVSVNYSFSRIDSMILLPNGIRCLIVFVTEIWEVLGCAQVSASKRGWS